MRLYRQVVGVPGLEPGKAGPESAVLPITPYPNLAVAFKMPLSNTGAKLVFFSKRTKF